MKKIIACLSVLFLLFLPVIVLGNEISKSEPQIEFDYSKYLAPKAWGAIQESQGVLFIAMPTFSQPKKTHVQVLVIDEKKGLILSVTHGLSEFPEVAFGESTQYSFLFKGGVFPARLKYADGDRDLAIFKVEGDLSKFKSVVFAKTIESFAEYYAFNQDADYSLQFGFYIAASFPFRARLVNKIQEIRMQTLNQFLAIPMVIEKLIFDKSIKFGFSGAGVFNDKGEVVGILKSSYLPGGYSQVIAANTILEFIEEYKTSEKNEQNKQEKK